MTAGHTIIVCTRKCWLRVRYAPFPPQPAVTMRPSLGEPQRCCTTATRSFQSRTSVWHAHGVSTRSVMRADVLGAAQTLLCPKPSSQASHACNERGCELHSLFVHVHLARCCCYTRGRTLPVPSPASLLTMLSP